METLVLDGKEYIKASAAAKAAGYTSDYVGQLCRSGAVDAHLIGRSWYVNQEQLGKHRVEKKRMSRVKAREQVRKAVEEKKKEQTSGGYAHVGIRKVHNFEKHGVSYESDESDLIPQVKKLQVKVDEKPIKIHSKEKSTKHEPKKEPDYVVENKGNKVRMSGSLDIVDVTDENFVGSGTIVLTPRIEKASIKRKSSKQSRVGDIQKPAPKETPAKEDAEPEKTDFLTKLARLEEDAEVKNLHASSREAAGQAEAQKETSVAEEVVVDIKQETAEKTKEPATHNLLLYITLGLYIVLILFTFTIESTWVYSGGGSKVTPPTYGTTYNISIPK